jgi:hypothetical protein
MPFIGTKDLQWIRGLAREQWLCIGKEVLKWNRGITAE